MTNNTTSQAENYSEGWDLSYLATVARLKPAITHQIKQLNLDYFCTVDDIINNSFVIINNLIKQGKLAYNNINDSWYYISNDPRSPDRIYNFKAWLRVVIFNHLQKLRAKQNQQYQNIDSSVDIDDRWDLYSNENLYDRVLQFELIDKISEILSKEELRIIEMHFFVDLKFKDIALILEAEGFPRYTEENLRQKKGRAIEKLRSNY